MSFFLLHKHSCELVQGLTEGHGGGEELKQDILGRGTGITHACVPFQLSSCLTAGSIRRGAAQGVGHMWHFSVTLCSRAGRGVEHCH